MTPGLARAFLTARVRRALGREEEAGLGFMRWCASYPDGGSVFDRPDYPESRRRAAAANSGALFAEQKVDDSHMDARRPSCRPGRPRSDPHRSGRGMPLRTPRSAAPPAPARCARAGRADIGRPAPRRHRHRASRHRPPAPGRAVPDRDRRSQAPGRAGLRSSRRPVVGTGRTGHRRRVGSPASASARLASPTTGSEVRRQVRRTTTAESSARRPRAGSGSVRPGPTPRSERG